MKINIVGSVGNFPGSEVHALEVWSSKFSHLSFFPPWTNFHPLQQFPPSRLPIFSTRQLCTNFRMKCVFTSLTPSFLFTCKPVEVEYWMLDPSLTCLSHNDSGTRANLWSVFDCLWFCASFWNFSLSPTISYSRVNMDIGVVSFVCTQLSLLTEFSVWSAYTSISHFAALRSDSRICAPWHHFHFNWALEAVRRPARS